MIKRIFLGLLILANNAVLGKNYIENTQELRNHLCNAKIDKQLIKEYIDELIFWKNIQGLTEAQNVLLAEKSFMSSEWKPFKSKNSMELSEGLNLIACGTSAYVAICSALIFCLESSLSNPDASMLKLLRNCFFGSSLAATITGLRLFCLANQQEALEKYITIKDILQYMQSKKDEQMLNFVWNS